MGTESPNYQERMYSHDMYGQNINKSVHKKRSQNAINLLNDEINCSQYSSLTENDMMAGGTESHQLT